jgi:hypothetical protein
MSIMNAVGVVGEAAPNKVVYVALSSGGAVPDDFAADTVLSGQITIATAGTAVAGTATPAAARVAVKAHPDNADAVWVGNDGAGDVTASNGFPLNPGEGLVLRGNLDQYWFDADSSGDKVCWVVVE